MAKRPIKLSNGREWSSQEEAKAHFRRIRDRYPRNVPIDDPADHDDLSALLERYDAAVTIGPCKTGSGIRHFETRENFANGGRTVGFWVVRLDDTETDFSFINAVAGAPKGESQQLSDAGREAVYEELKAAKQRFFSDFGDESGSIPCEVTGEFVGINEARLDYSLVGFQDIVWAFREVNDWCDGIPKGVISVPGDAQNTTHFLDPNVIAGFRQFHREKAVMRVVAKTVRRSVLLATRSHNVKNVVKLDLF